jgi:biopolymer transport protein ExbD
MMRKRLEQHEDDNNIDVTPMLDVVFILLIFFIVTASFVKETGIEIKRPSAVSTQTKHKASILVAINEAGDIWIDKMQVDIRTVRAHIERLRAQNPQGDVVVQADKNSKNGLLVKVMDAAREAGVEHVSIASDRIP